MSRQRSERLGLILSLRDRLGLSRLTEFEERAILERPVPERLLRRLSEPDEPLTPREREVMVLLASGYTRREIAFELGLSENTVKTHLNLAYARLGARNNVEAINAFIERAA